MIKEKYWLILEPYVHISIKKEKVLLYNTLNGEFLEYNKPKLLINLIKKTISNNNLLVVETSAKELENKWLSDFVKDIRKSFIGDIIPQSLTKVKPFQMMPIVKNMKDVKFLKKDKGRSIGENLGEYLNTITLHINNKCKLNCCFCKTAYKQGLCCTKGIVSKQLEINEIENIFKQVKNTGLERLNIIGGDIFQYSKFDELLKMEYLKKLSTNFIFNIQNADLKKINQIEDNGFNLTSLVSFNFDIELIEKQVEKINKFKKIAYSFLIRNEDDFNKSENLINKYKIENYGYFPLYSEENLQFFKENVFLDKEDILESNPTHKDIFARQQLNQTNFGKIIIMPNQDVYANLNNPKLGNLKKNTIIELLFKEMNSSKSWLKTRKNISPCKSCNYQYLCPSPSNYEYFIGKNDLCNIK